jgi:hypothetical protein
MHPDKRETCNDIGAVVLTSGDFFALLMPLRKFDDDKPFASDFIEFGQDRKELGLE